MPPEEAPIVRVVTWNIQHAAAGLDAVAAVLRALSPDVVLLQEVDRGTVRSGRVDQAFLLGETLGLEAAFAEAFPFDGGGYGLALLARGPLADVRVHRLPHPSPRRDDGHGEPRIAVTASWKGLHIGGTHLGLAVAERREQAVALRALAAPLDPLVLGGDFNEGPDAGVIASLAPVLADAFHAAGGVETRTGPEDRPQLRIDFIMSTFRAPRPRAAFVGPDGASDHRPVVVDFEDP